MWWFDSRLGLPHICVRLAVTFLLTSVPILVASSAALAQGKLAFSSTRSGTENADIYVMNSDGSAQTRLTTSSASDVDPTWSPDGSRLAFTRIGFTSKKVDLAHIWVMNADGSGQTQLTKGSKPETYPAWSPDGTQIAFTRGHVNKPETSNIFVINADGSHEKKLTKSPRFDGFPAWSPDGTKIAFTTDRDGNPEIYTMNADGSGQTRLTNNPASDAHPAWSSDGKTIAFISDRDGSFQLYVMPAGGPPGTERRLTSGFDQDSYPSGEYAPTWSPDGTTIAYAGEIDENFEIVEVSAAGGPVTVLSSRPVGFAPDWQPPPATPAQTALLGPVPQRPLLVDPQGGAGPPALLGPLDLFSAGNVSRGGSQGTPTALIGLGR
jgi:Tol biopolymer transport system component